MSATTEHPTGAADPHHAEGHHGAGHHGHDHGPFFAHHFESWQQQFDAGKLGMWTFLVQEVLFFSGLFCAYAVYRALRPEVFEYADQFLSVPHGAFNTVVLLFSSLTMAWGVRCAMLGQRKGLILCLGITLACAALFLGVKAYEYTEKYHAQLIWAGADPLSEAPGSTHLIELDPTRRAEGEVLEQRLADSLHTIELIVGAVGLIALAAAAAVYFLAPARLGLAVTLGCVALSAVSIVVGSVASMGIHHWMHGDGHHAEAGHDATPHGDGPHAAAASADSAGEHLDPGTVHAAQTDAGGAGEAAGQGDEPAGEDRPQFLGTFFGIYYVMTGLHAVHIIGGMIVITWLIVRAVKNHFTPEYFGPVDYVGLYWHLVDLVWIYLFPLLYLIG